jgi:tRNA(fMet)-specific endonuclease VapC
VSRLLLDTTFLIDAERVGNDLDDLIDDVDDVAIAAVTLAELRVGVLLARHAARRAARAAFVDAIAATVPVIAYDAAVAEQHARLLAEVRRQGRPRGAHDLIIAATGSAVGRIVVTADERAFEGLTGVEIRSYR